MKKIKRLLFGRRKNSGFTLVEVVVSCALLGILMIGVVAFITPILRSAAMNEENARANLLAETIDSYIGRSIRDSIYVLVCTDATDADAKAGGAITSGGSQFTKDLTAMKDFVTKAENKDIYQLKCISIRNYQSDSKGYEYKCMIYSESFSDLDNMSLVGTPYPIFEDCFYDGLFPRITCEQVWGTAAAPTGSDSETLSYSSVPTTSSGEELKPVPALKLNYEVYEDQTMNSLVFTGVGYCDINPIKNKLINAYGDYKFYGVQSVGSVEATANEAVTYIYYVMRKPATNLGTVSTPPATT